MKIKIEIDFAPNTDKEKIETLQSKSTEAIKRLAGDIGLILNEDYYLEDKVVIIEQERRDPFRHIETRFKRTMNHYEEIRNNSQSKR